MLCLLNFLRYRQGVSNVFNENYEDPNQEIGSAGAQAGQDSYRQAPFTNNLNSNAGYQQNNY